MSQHPPSETDVKSGRGAKRRPSRAFHLWPRSLGGQLIAALLLSLVLAQTISIMLFAIERNSITIVATRGQVLDRTASVVRMLNQTDPSIHERFIRAAEGPDILFSLEDKTDLSLPKSGSTEADLADRLERRAGIDANTVRFGKLRTIPFGLLKSDEDEQKVPDQSTLAPQSSAAPPPVSAKQPVRPDSGQNGGMAMRGPDDSEMDMTEDRPFRWRNWKDSERHPMRRFKDRTLTAWAQDMKVAVPLDSGQWLVVRTGMPRPPSTWGRPFLVSMIVTAICIILVVILVVRKLTAPLRELESASHKLGRGEAIEPLEEKGPQEIRGTIIAFNAMHDRLLRFVQDRTRMLAAVSHDLRTPITTLRLRTEFIEDDEMREKLQETLEEMQAMTDAVLAFAREDANTEETKEVNLAALLSSMAEDYQELGKDVSFDGPDNLVLSCRQVSLKRAIRNLTENALRYAGSAALSLSSTEKQIRIEICDDGPGIPADKLNDVFAPFFRVEGSRNLETGGVGLGLSITRTIIRSHGGDVTLKNRKEGGLRASIILPR
ncbi:ATP-binding protein [uncultured Cohaesibacter sp.]|uniref:ATP-binding protein n=1 Tax=uncultured Cohaesibacter sp. TaxID=1002546 RepID=UPI0029311AB5|nr:ATP-binding protein [uncultured Cohaesibacter sp.]